MDPLVLHDVLQAIAAIGAAIAAFFSWLIRRHQRSEIRKAEISRKFRQFGGQ